MFVRVAFSSVPLYQFLISVILLISTIILMIYISAKIFRIGILSYGKRPSLKELLMWLKIR